MAVYAPFHFDGLLGVYDLLLRHLSVAALAFNFGGGMFAVTEECKVRQFVNTGRRDSAVGHVDVTDFALLDGREAGGVAACRVLVAGDTGQLKGRVFSVIEGLSLAGSVER